VLTLSQRIRRKKLISALIVASLSVSALASCGPAKTASRYGDDVAGAPEIVRGDPPLRQEPPVPRQVPRQDDDSLKIICKVTLKISESGSASEKDFVDLGEALSAPSVPQTSAVIALRGEIDETLREGLSPADLIRAANLVGDALC
jgi:hypothetical protein